MLWGGQVKVIFTDVSKTFDTIPHQVILRKLVGVGFSLCSLMWVYSYLSCRFYRVSFRSALSDVYCAGLDSLWDWCRVSGLELNIGKCRVMSFSRKRESSIVRHDYYLGGVVLWRVSTFCDLGVMLDRRLDFGAHLNMILGTANSKLGFVMRWAREFIDPYVASICICPLIGQFSNMLVRFGHLFVLWMFLELNLFRRFLRFALRSLGWSDPFRFPPYEARLMLIDLQSLGARSVVADIVLIHQLVSEAIVASSLLRQVSIRDNVRNLKSVELYNVRSHSTDYSRNEPVTRMLRSVNSNSLVFDPAISKGTLKSKLWLI
ncbi:uncharacterized protein LOC129613911 [Condylostylus longicornis]|uniref:uncharacterized protein LOC129613911 n=1 Tax=Condylostylus longicornis TaxID=2530218 RepID=UPI00244DA403|nr:uncharacterized protein LOC129613911 [Condylostylus longicornis]